MTLAAGAADTVTFADWTADSLGVFAAKCSTELTEDAVPANDAADDSVVVWPPTGIEEDRDLPTAFSLDKVQPNPTSGRTVIRFGLPRPSAVDLSVYSAAGTIVSTLCNGTYPAGYYSFNCNLQTANCGLLPAGVYLVRFEAGAYTSTRKLVVQR